MESVDAYIPTGYTEQQWMDLLESLPDVTEGGTLTRCWDCGGLVDFSGDGHTHTCRADDAMRFAEYLSIATAQAHQFGSAAHGVTL
jgi:hypothetical protein